MNRDLFLAILSMDSYNRGYGRSIKFKKDESPNTPYESGYELGKAIILNIDLPENSEQSGFYALAYDVSGAGIDGLAGTVISYRGSDNFSGIRGFC